MVPGQLAWNHFLFPGKSALGDLAVGPEGHVALQRDLSPQRGKE